MKQPMRRNRSSALKCRPGPITRNPYLNFCREFRMKNKCQPVVQQIKEAAKAWHKLSIEDKTKYIVEAFYAKKILRRPRMKSRTRRNRGVRRVRIARRS